MMIDVDEDQLWLMMVDEDEGWWWLINMKVHDEG